MDYTAEGNGQDQTPAEPISLPRQSSPTDTANWEDRPFTTPTDRIVIETFQGNDNEIVVAE